MNHRHKTDISVFLGMTYKSSVQHLARKNESLHKRTLTNELKGVVVCVRTQQHAGG